MRDDKNSPVTGWGGLSEMSNVKRCQRCWESINYMSCVKRCQMLKSQK